MKWDEYYEKTNDWAASTAVSKISSLEDMGTSDEIVDVLYIIADEDEKGAARLINRALQHGIKFSGENLVEIAGLCSEESFQKALSQSADKLTTHDLEEMYGCLDDELVIEVSKKYHIEAPKDMLEEYEEELCLDTSTPINWKRFYDGFYEWSREYAIERSRALTDFGAQDEVMEVVNELFEADKVGASDFIFRAATAGVTFDEFNLSEISAICDSRATKQAVLASGSLLTEESLEELYGNVDDDVIIEVARKRKLKLPVDLEEESEEPDEEIADEEDFRGEISAAIDSAHYAIQCLNQALTAINTSGNISVVDMMSKKFFPSWMKYTTLEDAEREIRIAQSALESLNANLNNLRGYRNITLRYARLASVLDWWFDDDLMDYFTHMQIHKAQKGIRKAISQVEAIKRELERV